MGFGFKVSFWGLFSPPVGGGVSHPAAVPSLQVTCVFLRKCNFMSSLALLPEPPRPPGPAVTGWDSSSEAASPPCWPPVFLGDLLPALVLRLLWQFSPPNRSSNATWYSTFIANPPDLFKEERKTQGNTLIRVFPLTKRTCMFTKGTLITLTHATVADLVSNVFYKLISR